MITRKINGINKNGLLRRDRSSANAYEEPRIVDGYDPKGILAMPAVCVLSDVSRKTVLYVTLRRFPKRAG